MFSQLTTPLAIALFLSYVALAMVLTTAVLVKRMPLHRLQRLLWTGIGIGTASVIIRTVYFALT